LFIDWKEWSNNDFYIAEEVTIKGQHNKRPDIVLYINGIAVAVLELKRSTISVSEGIRQNLDSQMNIFIKNFFATNQLVMAGNEVKASIPKNLYMSIVKIQGNLNLDFKEACEVIAKQSDPKQKEFEKAVNLEADRRFKSGLMTQLNKAKKTISEKKYREGFIDGGIEKKMEYTVPCNVCLEDMVLSENMWEDAKEYLKSKRWGHAKCHEKNN
tara:strand:+ start:2730 stop:3368 length:639 start_codon:yes stop_codon:yes gene_type:complete